MYFQQLTIYDVAISIFNVSAKPASDKMHECINACVASLVEVWIKALSVNHVLSQRPVAERVKTIVNHYYNTHWPHSYETKEKEHYLREEKYSAPE